jgi:glutamyl-tRNA synthetase
MTRTRFAPSPTGDLHLGSAWTALASWIVARRASGHHVLRCEDLDSARVVSGARARIQDDLRWLGLDWDEGPVRQSERLGLYARRLEELATHGRVYPCDCSRAEIARATTTMASIASTVATATAPHAGEETVYPGTCRDRDPRRPMRRPPALRIRVPEGVVVAHDDAIAGRIAQNLAVDVGDFVLQRGDGVFAYQLAVVADDVAMGITDVVRGADLLTSTPRQIWLTQLLGAKPPRYAHVPLVVLSDGSRLAKRLGGGTVKELRDKGMRPERIIGALAHGLGLADTDQPVSAIHLAHASKHREPAWRRDPWPVPAEWQD